MFEEEGVIGTPMYVTRSAPTLKVSVLKFDNGYAVSLDEVPKPREPRRLPPPENPFSGMDPDQIIDQMIDGVGAVLRTFRDAEAGEDWKGGEDRAKVRTAFKAMFPGLAQQAVSMTQEPEEPDLQVPRKERRVFESKESLMKYLDENLKPT